MKISDRDLAQESRVSTLRVDLIALSIFIFALAIRLSYLAILLQHSPIDQIASFPADTRRYVRLANDFYNLTLNDENTLYMVGFGYGAFLALLFLITAKSYLFSLIIQLAIGSLGTAYIYKIGHRITGNRTLSIIAASINAISPTSLSLGTSLLSETVFFTCIVIMIYTIISILESPSIIKWILMAFLMAYAVSVRAVAQLLPFLVIFVFLAIPQRFFPSAKKRILRGCLISMSVVILLMALWAYRNYQVEGLFAVAGTGPGAAAAYLGERVAAAESDSLSVRDYNIMFNRELKDWMSAGENTTRRYNEWCMKKIKELIKANPIAFAQAYLSTVWENVTAYDEFPQFRFPRYKSQFIHLTEVVRKCKIDKIVLCLTLIGIIVLIAQGKFLIGILFSAIYAYFALISGFTWGQGSRIFYPSQTTGALLLATGAYYSYLYAWNKFGYILYQKTMSFLSPYSRKIFRDSQLRYIRPLAILAIIMIIFFSMALTLLHSRTPTYRAVANTGNQVFGDKIVLSQIRLEEKNDATIAVLFDCYSLSKVDENYRFYLHLNPISGGPMTNRDFAPGTPMSFWQPYIIETERRELNVKPGEYNVVMGIFYNVQRYLGDPYSFKITLK